MLRVLGPVEIDGRTRPSRAQRVLLAALALDAGEVVSVDRLAELIWGDDLPEHPEASLQNHVSRVRKLLPPVMSVRSAGDGYRLDAPTAALDVAAFGEGYREAGGQSPVDRIGTIDRALALWHGTPFRDLDDDRATAEAARLDEMRLEMRESRAGALAATGRVHEAIGELEAQRQEAPLRERTVELLMRTYVDAGRKSEALVAYRELRRMLVDQLGLDPSPELRRLEQAILTEDVVAARPASPGLAPPPPERDLRPGVPLPQSTLFGRDEELQRAGEAVREHRIVTLCGPGGVGKTRLALHVAAATGLAFGDGVTVVELASVRDPDALATAVATAYDLPPQAGRSAEERIIDSLAGRHHLLVLDNCDHVIDRAAALVEALVARAAELHVLATSREPLNIDGEHVVRVMPLAPAGAAAELFIDRAGAHRVGQKEEIGARRQTVVEICTALDGLPLAIELAAARSTSMSLDEIVAGLEQRFELLVRGRRTAPERHQSLRALVEWSVRELDDDLARVFTRTSVFSGTFTVRDAAEVTDMGSTAIAPALAELVDRSLLVEHRTSGRATRYKYLETIRQYAAERLSSRTGGGEMAAVTERHTARMVAIAERMRAALTTDDDVGAMEDVMEALPDVRVAHVRLMAAGDADRALCLAASLHFLALFRMQAEIFRWIRQTADAFGAADHPLAERVLASASIGSWQAGDLDGARAYAERAGAVADDSAHVGAGQGFHEAMADVEGFEGDTAAAAAHFDAALEIARGTGDELMVIADLADLAMRLGYLRRETHLAEVIGEASRRSAATGATGIAAWVAYAEGEAYADIDASRATTALTRALELADRGSARFITGVAGLTRAGILARLGDPAQAVPDIIGLIEHWRRSGAWVQLWITLRSVAELLIRLDRPEEAALVLGALDAAEGTGEASGPDAIRLAEVRSAVEEACPDADALYSAGAALGQRGVTDRSVDALVEALGARDVDGLTEI